MPSSATITTFYTFIPNSKARASQVNANFSVFRGHFIPIDPNTQTSANNTYDLGSSEWRWRSVYTKEVNLLSNTTTGGALKLYGETAGSVPTAIFSIAGTERFKVSQYGGYGATLAISTDGTDPGVGGICYSVGTIATANLISTFNTITAVSGSTVTLSTIGRPLDFFFTPGGGSFLGTPGGVTLIGNTATGLGSVDGRIYIATAPTTTAIINMVGWAHGEFRTTTVFDFELNYPLPQFPRISYPTSGSHTFFLMAFGASGTIMNLYNWKLGVKEVLE